MRIHLNKSFVEDVLEYCENKFVVDKALLVDALESLSLEFEHPFGDRSLVESV